jgi:hypothetical protein
MMLELAQEMLYRVKTEGPLPDTTGSPHGQRQYWKVSEAELEGPRIKAKLAMPGSDWMNVSEDGFWRPDVRIAFEADDASTLLLHYTGLVEQTDKFKQAAQQNKPTNWQDQYMRLSMHFETGSRNYAWLNRSLFVARGRLLGTGQIEYEVYRVA